MVIPNRVHSKCSKGFNFHLMDTFIDLLNSIVPTFKKTAYTVSASVWGATNNGFPLILRTNFFVFEP